MEKNLLIYIKLCYNKIMLDDFIKEKKKRAKFYETDEFYDIYDRIAALAKNKTLMVSNLDFIRFIDSVFERSRKKVFFKQYTYYGVIYKEFVLYKFYVSNNMFYIISPLSMKKNIII